MPNRLGRLKRYGLGFFRGTKEVVVGSYRHDVLGLATQIAYNALFSLFPFLLFLRALTAYMPQSERVADVLLEGLGNLISTDSRLYKIVAENVFAEINATSTTLLSLGIILTLFSASSAVMTLIKAVDRAYGLTETRSWQRRRLMAAGMAIGGALFIPATVSLLLFGSKLGALIRDEFGRGSLPHVLWVGLRWPVVFVLLVIGLYAFFFLAPSRRQRWYGILPGAIFSLAAIMGVSVGLSWFLSQNVFQIRWLTYGAIGTVIVLLFWAFLIGLVLLIGGEINGTVQRAVARSREGDRDGADEARCEGLIESEP
ncbi:MAG: YihY/virulence factor BrkB family protein [Thermoleophilia bacterium]|jgi:membrane protein